MAYYRVTQKQSGSSSFDFLAAAASTTAGSFDLTDSTIGGTTATRIPQYMFYNNKAIKDLSLTSITEVQLHAFHNADNIKLINLPNCETIGESAFDGIIYFTNYPNDSVINIPKCKTIGTSAFRNLRPSTGAVSDVYFTWHLDAVETISANGFRGANYTWKTREMYFPKLKQITGTYALAGITIETLHIGEDCTTLNNYCLHGSTVTDFIIEATTPPTLGNNGLGTPTQLSHIYVPQASVATYKATSGWSTYSSIIEAISA